MSDTPTSCWVYGWLYLPSEGPGRGLFTTRPRKRGVYVCPYLGEILTQRGIQPVQRADQSGEDATDGYGRYAAACSIRGAEQLPAGDVGEEMGSAEVQGQRIEGVFDFRARHRGERGGMHRVCSWRCGWEQSGRGECRCGCTVSGCLHADSVDRSK